MAQNAPRDEKWLLRHLSDLDRRVGSLETAPRAGHTAVAAGGVVVQNGGGVFIYDGDPAAGNLIVSVAAADGTDGYGNAYTRGLWINGYDVGASFTNQITFAPPDFGATTFDAAKIGAQTDASGRATLFVIGPDTLAGGVTSIPVIYLTGSNPADGGVSSIALDADTTQVSGVLTGSGIAGSVDVSFSSATSFTQSVTFPKPFAAPPAVVTNIASGSGAAAHWDSRAINVTATGFTLFVYAYPSGSAQTWSNIPVQWHAIGA